MHERVIQNCGLDVIAHELEEAKDLRGVSVSFHEGRIDYATTGPGPGHKEAVHLAEAVRSMAAGSVCIGTRRRQGATSAGGCWRGNGDTG